MPLPPPPPNRQMTPMINNNVRLNVVSGVLDNLILGDSWQRQSLFPKNSV